jgi:hypothetical protein
MVGWWLRFLLRVGRRPRLPRALRGNRVAVASLHRRGWATAAALRRTAGCAGPGGETIYRWGWPLVIWQPFFFDKVWQPSYSYHMIWYSYNCLPACLLYVAQNNQKSNEPTDSSSVNVINDEIVTVILQIDIVSQNIFISYITRKINV